MPEIAISSVRGIGVADIDRTSTSVRRALSVSLCSTPKRCSSSMMTRPSFLNETVPVSSEWVPITRSTSPEASPALTSSVSFGVEKRESVPMRTGKPA